MRRSLVVAVLLIAVLGSVYTFTSFFVIQPIGAIPDGRTLWIWRNDKIQFIDSADAICERELGGVSLFCRLGVLSGIAKDEGRIIARLPYIAFLYDISTGGRHYDR